MITNPQPDRVCEIFFATTLGQWYTRTPAKRSAQLPRKVGLSEKTGGTLLIDTHGTDVSNAVLNSGIGRKTTN